MPFSLRTSLVLGFGLFAAVGFSACSSPTAPEEAAPTGLFDESPLLPPLASAEGSAWQWIPTAGMRCRNGSGTGFGLRRAPGSPDLLILLQGGGACFDFLTCLLNRSSFGAGDFTTFVTQSGTAGVFDPNAPANPFADWNVIFVPYCTGDVHSGSAPNTSVPGVFGRQDFVGYTNMAAMLDRIQSQASRARQIVLAGESAGGFGTVGTYGLVADRLAPAPVDLLDDSGPIPPDDNVLPPSLQQTWRNLWNFDAALPPGCTNCSLSNGDGLENVLPFYAQQAPERTFGLLSHTEDFVIRFFFGGAGPQAFENSLYSIRATLPANAGTYYAPGDAHTFLLSDRFYTTVVAGTPLSAWTAALVSGQPTDVPVAPVLALAE